MTIAHALQLALPMMELSVSWALTPNTMVANAQKHLNLAIEWGAQNGLSFCPKKNNCGLFYQKV